MQEQLKVVKVVVNGNEHELKLQQKYLSSKIVSVYPYRSDEHGAYPGWDAKSEAEQAILELAFQIISKDRHTQFAHLGMLVVDWPASIRKYEKRGQEKNNAITNNV